MNITLSHWKDFTKSFRDVDPFLDFPIDFLHVSNRSRTCLENLLRNHPLKHCFSRAGTIRDLTNIAPQGFIKTRGLGRTVYIEIVDELLEVSQWLVAGDNKWLNDMLSLRNFFKGQIDRYAKNAESHHAPQGN